MIADSMMRQRGAISGALLDVDPTYQRKLHWIPRATAGLSYWGVVGSISKEIDPWIDQHIEEGAYTNLKSFVDYFAQCLNDEWSKTRHRPDDSVGFHVAGFDRWEGGENAPVFYHIHNGHLTTEAWPVSDNQSKLSFATGLAMDRCANSAELKARTKMFFDLWRKSRILWQSNSEPRRPFRAHRDFPDESKSAAEQLAVLNGSGYLTHNGDYMRFALVTMEGVLEKGLYEFVRLGHLDDGLERDVLLLESLLRRSLGIEPGPGGETIGGKTWSLGIAPPGRFVDTMRGRPGSGSPKSS